ncbi:hypothetical protein [Candidatus Palauibacter sp.]|uniref:hypothetical protein n=1 Tax=Candidatus Palauibacter sp. TaxID=3101350 RepID=UPI003B5C0F34
MIVARVLDPRSKLATARSLGGETMSHTLGGELGVGDADADELYRAMDWLLRRRDRIERHLAGRRLADGSLVLATLHVSTRWQNGVSPVLHVRSSSTA